MDEYNGTHWALTAPDSQGNFLLITQEARDGTVRAHMQVEVNGTDLVCHLAEVLTDDQVAMLARLHAAPHN